MPIFLNIFAAISLICSLIAFINLADGKSGVPRWTAFGGVALLAIAAASMFASKVLDTN